VVFKWFTNGTCAGDATATSGAFNLSGGVADATSFTQTPGVSGTFAFLATYSGDSTYSGSTGACEPLTVAKVNSTTVTDIHNAAHDVVTAVRAGTTVHDQATVSGSLGTPTGTVVFKWFTNGTCAGDATATSGAFNLSGGVADATSFTQTPNNAGNLAFQATYSGDNTYNASTGACEPLTVTKVDLAITKTASEPAVSVGQPFTYTLAVDNLGPSDATVDATVTDVLPADVSFVSFAALPAGVICNGPVGRTITCTIPSSSYGSETVTNPSPA